MYKIKITYYFKIKNKLKRVQFFPVVLLNSNNKKYLKKIN